MLVLLSPSGEVIAPSVFSAWLMPLWLIAAFLPPSSGTVMPNPPPILLFPYFHLLFVQLNEMIEKKHLFSWSTPPVAIRRFPQLLTLSWMAWWTSLTLSSFVRSMSKMSVSSTYKIADRWFCSFVIGQRNLVPCPFFPCALRIHILITAQPAGAAPFSWHNPCDLMLIPPPSKWLWISESHSEEECHVLNGPQHWFYSCCRHPECLKVQRSHGMGNPVIAVGGINQCNCRWDMRLSGDVVEQHLTESPIVGHPVSFAKYLFRH